MRDVDDDVVGPTLLSSFLVRDWHLGCSRAEQKLHNVHNVTKGKYVILEDHLKIHSGRRHCVDGNRKCSAHCDNLISQPLISYAALEELWGRYGGVANITSKLRNCDKKIWRAG